MSSSWIRECALREGWKKQPTGRPRKVAAAALVEAQDYAAVDGDAAPEERLKRLMDMMLREVEAIGLAAQRQGLMPDKARMDAAWSMIRVLERAEELARERAGGTQARRDEEMGDVLARIDRRIEELARAYARELAGAGSVAGADAQGLVGG